MAADFAAPHVFFFRLLMCVPGIQAPAAGAAGATSTCRRWSGGGDRISFRRLRNAAGKELNQDLGQSFYVRCTPSQ